LCCSPAGALEAKKQYLFSGAPMGGILTVPMGGFKATAFENCSYASNLGYSVSPREETGVLDEIGKTERDCYKIDKNFWMNQVNDKWDTFMFQQAYNWKVHDLPE
jgi:hypothetical protein